MVFLWPFIGSWSIVGLCALFLGCLFAPEIYPPDKVPPHVRQIKFVRLFGHDAKKSFEIDLAKDDLVTVMAQGGVSRGPSNMYGTLRIIAWIGKDLLGSPFGYSNGAT
ncbi:MAG: hypothetical protein MUC33_10730, partial [Desulfobacterales bacterium]|nr:hypothetical protein [Desulfobacterales bacterium]